MIGSHTQLLLDRVIKSRRMGWAGDLARMGERKGIYSVLMGKS
jgi:hypothetical protein